MRVMIFDDHQMVIDALCTFLQHKPDVSIVGTATRKQDIMELIANIEADILISDVLTDEELGLDLFQDIQKANYPIKILVYSSITSEFVKEFLQEYGVVAILSKKEPLERLWETLQLIDLNKSYQAKSKTEKDDRPPILSTKEKDIARYLSKGLAAKEIALLTGSSVNTINNQKNHLLSKFFCSNSTELTLKLTQMGYLKL